MPLSARLNGIVTSWNVARADVEHTAKNDRQSITRSFRERLNEEHTCSERYARLARGTFRNDPPRQMGRPSKFRYVPPLARGRQGYRRIEEARHHEAQDPVEHSGGAARESGTPAVLRNQNRRARKEAPEGRVRRDMSRAAQDAQIVLDSPEMCHERLANAAEICKVSSLI